MRFLQRAELPITVFITGGAVLILEVLATRMLSPYYGNTIYSVSSIITVVLLALALGYFFGGRIADKHPSHKWFYGIIFLGGCAVVFVGVLYMFVVPKIGYALSVTVGPLVLSMILFFIPSFLLGMLSPFAITLAQREQAEHGIGSISGTIFFWSTAGSIVGSLLTGFVLVPHFGVTHIVFGVGILLLLLSGIHLVLKVPRHRMIIILVVIASIVATFFIAEQVHSMDGTLYSRDGTYEKITVSDGIFGGRPTRFFYQDRSTSGAQYLDNPDELVFPYTKYYELYEAFNPGATMGLVIGGGIFSIPQALARSFGENGHVHIAEIEPSLEDVAQDYFHFKKDNPQLEVFHEDGRQMLARMEDTYDVIVSDVYYSLYSIPTHFTTKEFFTLAESRLNENGVFIGNLIGSLSRTQPSFIFSELKTFREVFPNSYVFAVGDQREFTPQNIIIIGVNGSSPLNVEEAKKLLYKDLPIDAFTHLVDLSNYNLDAYQTLTDQFAPVESLMAPVLNSRNKLSTVPNAHEILSLIENQVSLGPRYVGSPTSAKLVTFLELELKKYTPEVIPQTFTYTDHMGVDQTLTNVIARLWPERTKRIIVGTHFDTKKYARSLDIHEEVPGANNGASGTAILLELTRALSLVPLENNVGIDVVFFDGEEGDPELQNDFTLWKPLGSEYFASHLSSLYPNHKPVGGIILDMVCDKDLSLLQEESSRTQAGESMNDFWAIGKKLYPHAFSDKSIAEIRDDHTPLNAMGIPSFLVIDFSYPYIYSDEDTPDKCSVKSVETVATTLLAYLYQL